MLRPIKNNTQYEDALARVYELMQKDIKPESKDSDELEVLSILVKEYELEHYPVPKPSPLEATKFRIKQMGMSEAELSDILGARSRKSEILSGKRKLSLAMIRKLNQVLHLPAEVLIQAYMARRTFVTIMLEKGVPITVVQKLTQHSDIRTLMKYESHGENALFESLKKT